MKYIVILYQCSLSGGDALIVIQEMLNSQLYLLGRVFAGRAGITHL